MYLLLHRWCEDLGAVQYIVVSVKYCLCLLAGSICSCTGLGKTECTDLLAACQRGQVFCILLRCTPFTDRSQQRDVCADTITPVVRKPWTAPLRTLRMSGCRSLSAVLLRHRDSHEAKLLHLSYGIPREMLSFINLLCQRFHFCLVRNL